MSQISEPSSRARVEAREAVAALRAHFDRGDTRPLSWRREQLLRLRALVVENDEALLEALRHDLGKSSVEGRMTELSFLVSECDGALGSLKRWMGRERVRTPIQLQPGRSWIQKEPLGVVLIIAPWNYPLQLLLSPLVGALAAGNTAVLKPSEISAHTSELVAKLAPRYLDPGAVRVITGGVEETQALLAERFDHVFYTGNGRVAREVMRAAAQHLTPVTLELGGKSPCLIDASAKLDVAARRVAWGKFLNAGQTCVAPDYVLVDRELEQPFLEALERAVVSFYGADPRASRDYGRIINRQHHQRLTRLLEGEEVAFGGQADAESLYLAPTALRNADDESPVMGDEIFGPILPVRAVDGLEESIAFVRGREKPLALYVFAEDPQVQARVLEETHAGGMSVNGTILHLANPDLPFGGVGPSGTGAYHGRASFDVFTHRKSVYSRATWIDPSLLYPPYGKLKARWLERLL